MKTSTTICTTIICDDADEKELIDWKIIVSNLHIKRTLKQIARTINCDEKMLGNLKNGVTAEPKFSTGIQLLAQHGLYFPNQHKAMGLAK